MKTKGLKSDNKQNANSQIDSLLRKDESAVKRIYDQYRSDFIRFMTINYRIDLCTAEDVYQESFLILHQKIQEGKLTTITYSLKSYLFRIGINTIKNYFRSKKNVRPKNIDDIGPILDVDTSDSIRKRKQDIANLAVSTMKEPCLTVLTLFFWQEKSIEEIRVAIGYETKKGTSNSKSKCLTKLKKYLLDKFSSEGLIEKRL